MTPDELKSKHAAMTPGKWHTANPGLIEGDDGECPGDECEYCDGDGCVHVIATHVYGEDAAGIVAIHNHFPALMRRHEEMRRSCEWMLCALEHHGPYSYNDPALVAARTALANANSPLEATS